MAEKLPKTVRIREVGPRDGFQNEPEVLATADKMRLIDMLARTGLRRLEVTKLRGCAFREGYHDYLIRTGGVVVAKRW